MLSSDEEIFNNAIGPYKEALLKSGYDIDEGSGNELKFTPNAKKRKRKSRPTVWFNPPFSLSVKTNIGGQKKAVSTSDLRFSESVHISVNLPWVWSNLTYPPFHQMERVKTFSFFYINSMSCLKFNKLVLELNSIRQTRIS